MIMNLRTGSRDEGDEDESATRGRLADCEVGRKIEPDGNQWNPTETNGRNWADMESFRCHEEKVYKEAVFPSCLSFLLFFSFLFRYSWRDFLQPVRDSQTS